MKKYIAAIFAAITLTIGLSGVAIAAPPSTPEQCQMAWSEGYGGLSGPNVGNVYGLGCTPNSAYNGPGQIQDLGSNRIWTCISIVVAADPNTSTSFGTRGYYCRLN